MTVKLKFTLKEDLLFKDTNDFFHKIFTTALFPVNVGYSYFIPKYKVLNKDKEYTLLFSSENEESINKILNLKNPKIKINEYNLVSSTFDSLKKIKINSVSFNINKNQAEELNINLGERKNTSFSPKFHTIDILRKLIISDVNRKYKKLFNKEVEDFIEDIEITNSYFFNIKNAKAPVVDVLLKMKKNRDSIEVANFLLNNGIGGKLSYGCGFVEQEN